MKPATAVAIIGALVAAPASAPESGIYRPREHNRDRIPYMLMRPYRFDWEYQREITISPRPGCEK